MTFERDVKNISETLLKYEVEDLESEAKALGLSEEQTKEFVKNSVIHSIQHECESVQMEKAETDRVIQKTLESLGFKSAL